MSNKQYVCGKCGQVGHNRRTCRKTAPAPAPPPRPVPPQLKPSQPDLNSLNEAVRALRGDTPEAEPVVETMTAEDIETWWILASGKTGKRRIEEGTPGHHHTRTIIVDWYNADTDRLLTMLNLAVKQKTSPKALKKFLNHFGAEAKTHLAYDNQTPETVLLILAKDPSPRVRRTLTAREHLTTNLITILASDKDHLVRARTAKHRETPGPILEKIFQEQDTKEGNPRITNRPENDIDSIVAAHPNLPTHQRQKFLASERKNLIRCALANPNTTADDIAAVWKKHKNDKHGNIIESILKNPKTTTPILDEYVEQKIFTNETNPHTYSTSTSTLYETCQHKNMSPETLHRIAHHITNNPEANKKFATTVPFGIINNPNTTNTTLQFLAENYHNAIGHRATDLLQKRTQD